MWKGNLRERGCESGWGSGGHKNGRMLVRWNNLGVLLKKIKE